MLASYFESLVAITRLDVDILIFSICQTNIHHIWKFVKSQIPVFLETENSEELC